jgi:hypothetical protein
MVAKEFLNSLSHLDDEYSKVDSKMDDIMNDFYESMDRDYQEEVRLLLSLENSYSKGNVLVDALIETALLYRNFIVDINEKIKKLIVSGKYDVAESTIQKVLKLVDYIHINSVAKTIQDEMKKILEN